MAKRFTATEKWDDPFFCNLEAKYKLAWIYLLDKCDNAGIYDVNIKALSFFVGFDFNEDDLLSVFDGRIEKIKNGNKWFIPKFIEFQYGALRHECYPHRPVIEKLSKLGLLENKGSFRVSARVQDKDKEKDKEKDKDINADDFNMFWDLYDKKVGKPNTYKEWLKINTEEKKKIFEILPIYIKSKPDKKFRKDPERFLKYKVFNDEIIEDNNGTTNQINRGNNSGKPESIGTSGSDYDASKSKYKIITGNNS